MNVVLTARPRDEREGLPVPFVSEDDKGLLDHAMIVRRRAIRCALSRICGVCGESLTWPVALIGPEDEAAVDLFRYPPLHPGCARDALTLFAPLGDGFLGHIEAPQAWALTLTSGFDLVRPQRRGQPVLFRPNSVIESTTVSAS